MNPDAMQSSKSRSRILVVGASGRMTASMLSGLGFSCSVADLFADRDTEMICSGRVTRLSRLGDLHLHENLVRDHDYVVFSGGLEGSVELAEKVAQWAGRSFALPASVAKSNEVKVLNDALAKSGLDRFPFQRNPTKLKLPAISKSLGGSGKVSVASNWLHCLKGVMKGRVFQDVIEGQAVSQIYVGDGHSAKALGGSTLLNRTMSWIGSVSGLVLSEAHKEASTQLATSFVELTGIEGVFGIDFVRNEDGLWPIDFNPRIPASAEVVGDHILQEHMATFGINVESGKVTVTDSVHGKLVVFNTTADAIKFELNKIPKLPFRHQSNFSESSIADVPHEGEIIKPGRPILTVFVAGTDVSEVEAELREKSYEIQARLSL